MPAGPPVRRLVLLAHEHSPAVLAAVARAEAIARERGATVEAFVDEPGIPSCWPSGRGLRRFDLAVVLGGDGATLHALHAAIGTGVPVVAFNFGHLGFLTSAAAGELETGLPRVLAGEAVTMALPTVAVRGPDGQRRVAVNDAVVLSDRRGHSVLLDTWIDGVEFGQVRCDGIVVATPVGSTAYSLAAGGPLLGWGTNALALSFIAAHTLTVRSFVLPRGHLVEIENATREGNVRLILDGEEEPEPYPPGARLRLRFGRSSTHLAFLPEVSIVERLRDTFAPLGLRPLPDT